MGVLARKTLSGFGFTQKTEAERGGPRGAAPGANAAHRRAAAAAPRPAVRMGRRRRATLSLFAAHAQCQAVYLAVSCLRKAIRSARSSGFFSPAKTILVPAGGAGVGGR